MDARVAAMFWVAMERGASLIVAADPPSSGKTTTLSALLSFTRPETAVYFTSGVDESFALPAASTSYDTYILVNEMSDHIPVYTWDDNARRAFELLSQGYRLGTTMHDETVEGVLRQLEGDLRIPKAHVAHLTFVVPLHIARTPRGIIRRVREVTFIQPNGKGYRTAPLVAWDETSDAFQLFGDQAAHEAFADWAQLTPADLDTQVEERTEFLEALRQAGATTIPEVNNAIEEYYEKGRA